jgi:hypothetical protein
MKILFLHFLRVKKGRSRSDFDRNPPFPSIALERREVTKQEQEKICREKVVFGGKNRRGGLRRRLRPRGGGGGEGRANFKPLIPYQLGQTDAAETP